jgi:anti-sigma factor RsiW
MARRLVPGWGVDHLSQDAVVAFVDGELSEGAHGRATRHVAHCPDCAVEVHAQRQVRAALRHADEPSMPASLLSMLRSIPQDAELPPPPPGLAVTADGQFVSVLRPEHMNQPPAGMPTAQVAPQIPGQSRGRMLRVGATAVSGLALGAIAFVSLPGAVSPAVQPESGVLGGPVLTSGQANFQPVAVRPTATSTPTPTPEPEGR